MSWRLTLYCAPMGRLPEYVPWVLNQAAVHGLSVQACAKDAEDTGFLPIRVESTPRAFLGQLASYDGEIGRWLLEDYVALSGTGWLLINVEEWGCWTLTLIRGQETRWFSPSRKCAENEYGLRDGFSAELIRDWLCDQFGIGRDEIERYFIDWNYRKVDANTFTFTRKGKAYDSDECAYGESSQVFDLLKKAGVGEPLWNTLLVRKG